MNARDVHLAVDAALMAHAGLQALVGGRIFSEVVPEKTPLPYIRYGSSGELNNPRFGRDGSRGDKVIDVFGAHKDQVLQVADQIHAALHRVRLPLPGDGWCVGVVELTGTVPDEVTGAHAVVRYLPRVP